MGVSQGAAAAMYAAIKDTSIEAFVGISMFSFAADYTAHHLKGVLAELKEHSTGWQQKAVALLSRSESLSGGGTQISKEEAEFMNKESFRSVGWFLDAAAQLNVIYGAGYRAWLHGHADPH